ncbi:hypothetical protein [Actinopolyspora erythraea]|nr:hypothetical protein [Actinopolyspora erythraea]
MSTPTILESSSTEPAPDFDLDVTVVAMTTRTAREVPPRPRRWGSGWRSR